MLYHVIIDLNSLGKRRVGKIISLMESEGFEFLEIKKTESASSKDFFGVEPLILQSKLQELEAMNFYQETMSPEALRRNIGHLYGNHVELFFEKGEKDVDPNDLWELIIDKVYNQGKEMPIIFVATTYEENGLDESFIPSNFGLEPVYFNSHAVIPNAM